MNHMRRVIFMAILLPLLLMASNTKAGCFAGDFDCLDSQVVERLTNLLDRAGYLDPRSDKTNRQQAENALKAFLWDYKFTFLRESVSRKLKNEMTASLWDKAVDQGTMIPDEKIIDLAVCFLQPEFRRGEYRTLIQRLQRSNDLRVEERERIIEELEYVCRQYY